MTPRLLRWHVEVPIPPLAQAEIADIKREIDEAVIDVLAEHGIEAEVTGRRTVHQ